MLLQEGRLGGLWPYLWTLLPHCLVSLALLMVMVGLCPCCVILGVAAKQKRRPPFRPTAGLAFYVTFGLLGLLMVLSAIFVLEERQDADGAYRRAKCASLWALDYLAGGSEAGGGPFGDFAAFAGFARLGRAANESQAEFPVVLRDLAAAEANLASVAGMDSFEEQASQFLQDWGEDRPKRLNGTQFECKPCTNESLRPLADALASYRSLSGRLEAAFSLTRAFIGHAGAAAKWMQGDTLKDAEAIKEVTCGYGRELGSLLRKWERYWDASRTALRAVAPASLALLLTGVLALALCANEGCAFIAWWSTYLLTVSLLILPLLTFPAAAAANDAVGLLHGLLSEPARGAYNVSLLVPALTQRQAEALGSCVTSDGAGNVGRLLHVTMGGGEAEDSARLLSALQALGTSRLEVGSLDRFFEQYEPLGEDAFTARWNSSQTLSPDGLAAISARLARLAAEQWAFQGHEAPPDCPLARPFSPGIRVVGSNCFFVTAVRPTREEVEERYFSLDPEQLWTLLGEFEHARAAAQAFAAVGPTANNARAVHRSWSEAARSANAALEQAKVHVLAPMTVAATDTLLAANATNCRGAYEVYLLMAQALGQDFVSAQVLVWACSILISFGGVGLTALYCLLWCLRQSGASGHSRLPLRARLSDEGDGEDGEEEGAFDENEEEELQPLKGSWRR